MSDYENLLQLDRKINIKCQLWVFMHQQRCSVVQWSRYGDSQTREGFRWCQESHRLQIFEPLVNNASLEPCGHALPLQFPPLCVCVLRGGIQMALTDGCCGLRRDYNPLFPSPRCSLRLQELCDTVAQLALPSISPALPPLPVCPGEEY